MNLVPEEFTIGGCNLPAHDQGRNFLIDIYAFDLEPILIENVNAVASFSLPKPLIEDNND